MVFQMSASLRALQRDSGACLTKMVGQKLETLQVAKAGQNLCFVVWPTDEPVN